MATYTIENIINIWKYAKHANQCRLYLHMAVKNTGKPFENVQKYTKQCGGI